MTDLQKGCQNDADLIERPKMFDLRSNARTCAWVRIPQSAFFSILKTRFHDT